MNCTSISVRRRCAAVAASAVLTAVLLPAVAGGAVARETDQATRSAQPSTTHEWNESEAAEYAGGAFANKDRAYEAYLDGRSHWEQAAARVAAGDRTGTLPTRPATVVHVDGNRPWGLAAVGFAGIIVGLLAAGLTGRVRRRARAQPGRAGSRRPEHPHWYNSGMGDAEIMSDGREAVRRRWRDQRLGEASSRAPREVGGRPRRPVGCHCGPRRGGAVPAAVCDSPTGRTRQVDGRHRRLGPSRRGLRSHGSRTSFRHRSLGVCPWPRLAGRRPWAGRAPRRCRS